MGSGVGFGVGLGVGSGVGASHTSSLIAFTFVLDPAFEMLVKSN